jgi:hypothetical protein
MLMQQGGRQQCRRGIVAQAQAMAVARWARAGEAALPPAERKGRMARAPTARRCRPAQVAGIPSSPSPPHRHRFPAASPRTTARIAHRPPRYDGLSQRAALCRRESVLRWQVVKVPLLLHPDMRDVPRLNSAVAAAYAGSIDSGGSATRAHVPPVASSPSPPPAAPLRLLHRTARNSAAQQACR